MSVAVREIAGNYDSRNFETSLAEFEKTFRRIYAKKDGILFSGEPPGVFACNYGATNQAEATVAVGVLAGRNPNVNSASAVKGVAAAVAFLEGRHDQFAQAQIESFERLRHSWEMSAKSAMGGLQSKTQVVEDQIRNLDTKATAFDKQAEKLVAEKKLPLPHWRILSERKSR